MVYYLNRPIMEVVLPDHLRAVFYSSSDIYFVMAEPEYDAIKSRLPAKTFVLQAIASGKHVVTANKALLAAHGNEIFAAAQKAGVMVAFEAAVDGTASGCEGSVTYASPVMASGRCRGQPRRPLGRSRRGGRRDRSE